MASVADRLIVTVVIGGIHWVWAGVGRTDSVSSLGRTHLELTHLELTVYPDAGFFTAPTFLTAAFREPLLVKMGLSKDGSPWSRFCLKLFLKV